MASEVVDLRSDTVTRPSAGMRAAMAAAEVGDDVYGEDPTVNRLERIISELLGKEAAVFAPSGTQSNLIGLLAHCERGDEYIVGQQGHTYKYEGGGAAVLGSIQPQPLEYEPDGTLDLEKVETFIKPRDPHFARTTLLCLENTQNGRVLPLKYLSQAGRFVRERHLGLHLDGARLFNAAVFLSVEPSAISRNFDTVSVCLSKGLGAPLGSLLVGRKDLVDRARRWRKVLGGGMRQVGMVAAAGIYALAHHVDRLGEDHANAEMLCEGLSSIEGMEVDRSCVATNMVFAHLSRDRSAALAEYLKFQGILIRPGNPVRLVTHMDVVAADIHRVVSACRSFFGQSEH